MIKEQKKNLKKEVKHITFFRMTREKQIMINSVMPLFKAGEQVRVVLVILIFLHLFLIFLKMFLVILDLEVLDNQEGAEEIIGVMI